jgi:diaminopimelate decarboxylase
MNSKVLALINAKKVKHETSLVVDVDSRNNMETTIRKWKHIFEVVMANSRSHHHHNRPTKINGGLCMEITRKYMTTKMLQATMKNIRTCL